MAQFFQITTNEILSGISKAIYDVYGDSLAIYKDKQQYLQLPAVTIYCVNYEKTMGRSDTFTNKFDVIINYFTEDTSIINSKRQEMFSETEKIIDAIKYIQLPAYNRNNDGTFVETTLPSRSEEVSVEEKEEFMQISVTYTVRTKHLKQDEIKMKKLYYNEQIGG